MQIFQESWQARSKAEVADSHSRIPKEWLLDEADLEDVRNQRDLTGPFIESLLNDRKADIIRNNSLQLAQKIKSQRHTAVEVVQAYFKTTAIAHQIVGELQSLLCVRGSRTELQNICLHEIMFDKALRTAQGLDKYLKETGSVEGTLHGIPISLKNQFHIEDYDTTVGYVGWVGTHEGDKNPSKVHKVNS